MNCWLENVRYRCCRVNIRVEALTQDCGVRRDACSGSGSIGIGIQSQKQQQSNERTAELMNKEKEEGGMPKPARRDAF